MRAILATLLLTTSAAASPMAPPPILPGMPIAEPAAPRPATCEPVPCDRET